MGGETSEEKAMNGEGWTGVSKALLLQTSTLPMNESGGSHQLKHRERR